MIAATNIGLTTTEAAGVAGLTYRRVSHWAKTGLVAPSISDSRGRGFPRRYSLRDCLVLAVLAEFRRGGLGLQALHDVQDYLAGCDMAELQGKHAKLLYAPDGRHANLLGWLANRARVKRRQRLRCLGCCPAVRQ